MSENIQHITLAIVFAPLLGALIAGLFGKKIGLRGAHLSTIILVACSFVSAVYLAKLVLIDHMSYYGNLYTWWGGLGEYGPETEADYE